MAKIYFSQTITGQERKAIAAVIAQATGSTVSYAGAPSFAYLAHGWAVSKNSQVVSPELEMSDLGLVKAVITALMGAGLKADGVLLATIKGINEEEVVRLNAVIKSKETLLKRALQSDEPLTVSFENGEAAFQLFAATLDPDKLCTYLALVEKLAEFAKTLKYTSSTEKVVDNEKYAFRCFLLRLGFIGTEYKIERKILLAPLSGNTAFKNKCEEVMDE